MLPGPFNAPRALGCRSPRSSLKHTHPHLSALSGLLLCFNHPPQPPLKHTHPPLSTLCGLLLCFNARQVPLLPRFGP